MPRRSTLVVMVLLAACTSGQEMHYVGPGGPGVEVDHLCDSNTAIEELPSLFSQCAGCSGRCGDVFRSTARRAGHCDCDSACMVYGTCCIDLQQQCPRVYQQALQIRHDLHPINSTQMRCQHNGGRGGRGGSIYVVHTCNSEPCETHVPGAESDPDLWVPVYDNSTGLNYVNGACGRCNGASDLHPWHVDLVCVSPLAWLPAILPEGEEGPAPTQSWAEDHSDVGDVGRFREMVSEHGCSIRTRCTGGCRSRKCHNDVIRSCPPGACARADIVSLCEDSPYQFLVTDIHQYRSYRNPACAACTSDTPITCYNPLVRDFMSVESIATFSLALLMNYDPTHGVHVGVPCGADEYLSQSGECVAITCPQGYIQVNGTCVDVAVQSTVSFTVCIACQAKRNMQRFSPAVGLQFVQETLLNETAACPQSEALDCSVNKHTVLDIQTKNNGDLTLKLKIAYGIRHEQSVNVSEVQRDLESGIFTQILNFDRALEQTSNYILESAEMCEMDHDTSHGNNSGAFVGCRGSWTVYDMDNVTVVNDSVLIILGNNNITTTYINVDEHSVLVCVPAANEETGTTSTHDVVLGMITVILTLVSLLLLLVRLVLQGCVPAFRGIPGQMQFHLVIAMFLAYSCLLLSPLLTNPIACTISAIVKHYMFLAMFLWMNAIAIHSYRIFGPKNFSKTSDSRRVPRRFLVLGWLVPLIISIIAITTEYTAPSTSTWRPAFGDSFCWFTNTPALLLFFGAPFLLSLATNVILYSLIARILYRSFQQRNTATTQENSHSYKIYVRLFVLMGLTWITAVVATFSRSVPLWYVFVVLNSSQGIFLFVGFVCTRRVKQQVMAGEVYSYVSSRLKSTSDGGGTRTTSVSDDKNCVRHHSRTHNNHTRDNGTRDNGIRDNGTRDTGIGGSNTRDGNTRDSNTRDSNTRDSNTRDNDTRGNDTRGSGTCQGDINQQASHTASRTASTNV